MTDWCPVEAGSSNRYCAFGRIAVVAVIKRGGTKGRRVNGASALSANLRLATFITDQMIRRECTHQRTDDRRGRRDENGE